jgi:hypothetical protein
MMGMMAVLLEVERHRRRAQRRMKSIVTLRTNYSLEQMAKRGPGTQILRDYTFNRPAPNPNTRMYYSRLRGQDRQWRDRDVKRGVHSSVQLKPGQYGLADRGEAGRRGALAPRASSPTARFPGVLGGYRDWREISSTYVDVGHRILTQAFQQPALYNSLKRNADGINGSRDRGIYTGISTAY